MVHLGILEAVVVRCEVKDGVCPAAGLCMAEPQALTSLFLLARFPAPSLLPPVVLMTWKC